MSRAQLNAPSKESLEIRMKGILNFPRQDSNRKSINSIYHALYFYRAIYRAATSRAVKVPALLILFFPTRFWLGQSNLNHCQVQTPKAHEYQWHSCGGGGRNPCPLPAVPLGIGTVALKRLIFKQASLKSCVLSIYTVTYIYVCLYAYDIHFWCIALAIGRLFNDSRQTLVKVSCTYFTLN